MHNVLIYKALLHLISHKCFSQFTSLSNQFDFNSDNKVVNGCRTLYQTYFDKNVATNYLV